MFEIEQKNPDIVGLIIVNDGFVYGQMVLDQYGKPLGRIHRDKKDYIVLKTGKNSYKKLQKNLENVTWRLQEKKEKQIFVVKQNNSKKNYSFPKGKIDYTKQMYLDMVIPQLKNDTGYEFKCQPQYTSCVWYRNNIYCIVHIPGLYCMRRDYDNKKLQCYWISETNFKNLRNINMGVRYYQKEIL